jgi:hypothetical protein
MIREAKSIAWENGSNRMKALKQKLVVVLVACAAVCPGLAADWPPAVNTPSYRSVVESTNAAWLENVAQSLSNAQKLKPPYGMGGGAKGLRTAAYVRLGALATEESLAAVERLEQQARGQSILPRTAPLGTWNHPSWHNADSEVVPLAQAKTPGGRTYAVILPYLLGGSDVFLISTTTPEARTSWSRPVLVPGRTFPNVRESRLTAESEELLTFDYSQETSQASIRADGTLDNSKRDIQRTGHHQEIRLADVLRDTDHDGWTDFEEERLALDPNNPDTDGDGLADGMDPCPNFAPPQNAETNEDIVMIQKAVFATFGLSGSQNFLIVGTNSLQVQIWGYAGPIIYRNVPSAEWLDQHGSGTIFASWHVERTGDEARVGIGDYEGPRAGAGQTVLLKKIRGKWYAVGLKFGGGS